MLRRCLLQLTNVRKNFAASNCRSVCNEVVNRKARLQLAAAYRIMDRLKLNEGICNHLSLMTKARDGTDDVMLMIPYGVAWSQVTASNLIGINSKNEVVEGSGNAELSAQTIHLPIHKKRPFALAIFHLHSPYSSALSCLQDPKLYMTHQNSIRFLNNVTYDYQYNGFSQDFSEGHRLADVLQHRQVLVMANHGILVAADNVAMAFDASYYFERAAMYQILAQSTGQPLRDIYKSNPQLCERQSGQNLQPFADDHFNAMVEVLKRESPEFQD